MLSGVCRVSGPGLAQKPRLTVTKGAGLAPPHTLNTDNSSAAGNAFTWLYSGRYGPPNRSANSSKPGSLVAKVLYSRVLLRLGEREQAIALLQETHGPQKPESFASGDDEEAWFQACQLLGDLYLEVGKPDLAVSSLNDFRKSAKSGARTLFKMGQAFEQLGDVPKAKRCYEQVTAYEGNPLAPEAYDALARLQA